MNTTPMKKNNRNKLAGQYLAALRSYVEHGAASNAQATEDVGVNAVAMGLETLDMAKMHDEALASMNTSGQSTDAATTKMASAFFDEVITPIEKTHSLAVDAAADLDQMKEKLGEQTKALADSKREIQQEVKDRGTAEAALKTSEKASGQLLRDSRLLEAHLQDMARKILAANEDERKKMSLQLQDEIAQTLLGIHVRLLALKKEVAASKANVTHEIALIQRLVAHSVTIINRLAKEFGSPS